MVLVFKISASVHSSVEKTETRMVCKEFQDVASNPLFKPLPEVILLNWDIKYCVAQPFPI